MSASIISIEKNMKPAKTDIWDEILKRLQPLKPGETRPDPVLVAYELAEDVGATRDCPACEETIVMPQKVMENLRRRYEGSGWMKRQTDIILAINVSGVELGVNGGSRLCSKCDAEDFNDAV